MQSLSTRRAIEDNKRQNGRLRGIARCFVALAVYKALLDYAYVCFVAARWSYAGFVVGQFDAISLITSGAGLLLAAYAFELTERSNRFSSVTIALLILMSFVPGLTLVQNVNTEFFVVFFGYWMFLLLFYRCSLFFSMKRIKLFSLEKWFSPLSIAITLFVFFIWGVYANFHIQLDLINVYELRAEASNYAMPRVFYYISGAMQICIPLLMVFGLKSRKYFSSLLLFIAQIIVFFSTGSKSILASTIIAVVMFAILSKLNLPTGKILLCSFIAIVVAAIAATALFDNSIIVDYFLRRNLFLPNLLSIDYFDYFSVNEPDYFRTSLLKYFGVSSPYAAEGIPNMIARLYFDSPDMYSNNGLISDAVTNLGIIGIGIMPLIIAAFLFVIDCCAGFLDRRLVVCSSIYFVFALIGSALFISMFSHGFVLFAFLLTGISEDDAGGVSVESGPE